MRNSHCKIFRVVFLLFLFVSNSIAHSLNRGLWKLVRNESRFNGLSLRLCTSDLVVDFQCPDSFAIAAKMKIKRDFLIASRYTFVALRPLEVTDIFKGLSVGGRTISYFPKPYLTTITEPIFSIPRGESPVPCPSPDGLYQIL